MTIYILMFYIGAFAGFGLCVFTMSAKLSGSEALRIAILGELSRVVKSIDSSSNGENDDDSEQSLQVIKSRIENACKKIEGF